MKKLTSLLVYSAAAAVFTLASCKKEEGCTDPEATNYNSAAEEDDGSCAYPTNEYVLSGELETQTLDPTKVYTLSGRAVVPSGKVLTIEPGTIIKAEGGREANASVLIVARGGKIMANGTAAKPIIFTSILDEIMPGETISPNLDESFRGLWGGVIILGNAKISADATEKQIEGIPPSDPNGLYGGNNDADNSGEFTFVSIRHGGTLIGDGNEINGLTLGGVGNGTKIENIEIVSNLDDGLECFGGAVNVTNILVWNVADDTYDIDQSYSGTIKNFVGIAGSETDHGFEIDGPEGSLAAGFTMTNGTMIGYDEAATSLGEYADFRDGARGNISNVYWKGFAGHADVELDDDVTSTNYLNGDLVFTNWQFNVPSSGNITLDQIFADKSTQGGAFGGDYSFASVVTSPTVGATMGDFSWTWAVKAGEINP